MTRTQVTGRRSPCTVTRPGPGAAARHRRRVPATGSARRRVPEGLHSSCRLTLLSHGTASRGIRIPATGSGCRWTGAARRRRIPGPRPARWTRRRGPGVAARPPWDPLRPPGAAARNRIPEQTRGFPPPARCRTVQGDTGAGAAVAVPDAAPDRFPVRRRRIPKPPPRASRNAIRYRITFRIRDRGALYVCSGTRHGTRPGTGSRFAMRNVPMFSVSKLEYSSQLNTKTRDVIRYRITKRFAVRHPRLRRHASTTRN